MNRFESLRLAQFWHSRIQRLINLPSDELGVSTAQVFEAAGWLIEGVFCGFFDPREADIVWARLRPIIAKHQDREASTVSERLRNQVGLLLSSKDPFPDSSQMTEGPQMAFELPLFPQALLLSDRLDSDATASACIEALYMCSGERWSHWKESWTSVDSADVVSRLTEPFSGPPDTAGLLAGYLSLLEHMDASRTFFEYAKRRSTREVDFDSYCQRIGDLNGWRVPLADFRGGRERFDQLAELLEFAIRRDFKERIPNAQWSDFHGPFQQHVGSLVAAWETYHLAGSLVSKSL
jgi:hypothetical protein